MRVIYKCSAVSNLPIMPHLQAIKRMLQDFVDELRKKGHLNCLVDIEDFQTENSDFRFEVKASVKYSIEEDHTNADKT